MAAKKILVALDLEHDDLTNELLSIAAQLADVRGGTLELVTVVPATPVEAATFLPAKYEKSARESASEVLDGLAAGLDFDRDKVTCEVRFGNVYKEILAAADQFSAELIVIGCHKPDVSDYLLGSNAARVVRHAACSVYVVR